MAVLKGGPTFSAYLLGTSKGLSGTWNTGGILTGSNKPGPGLPHFTWYKAKQDPPRGVIPVPAGLPLLLLAMGVFGIVRARKRKAADLRTLKYTEGKDALFWAP